MAELGDLRPDLQALRLAADVRDEGLATPDGLEADPWLTREVRVTPRFRLARPGLTWMR